jgi:hypothetical protein
MTRKTTQAGIGQDTSSRLRAQAPVLLQYYGACWRLLAERFGMLDGHPGDPVFPCTVEEAIKYFEPDGVHELNALILCRKMERRFEPKRGWDRHKRRGLAEAALKVVRQKKVTARDMRDFDVFRPWVSDAELEWVIDEARELSTYESLKAIGGTAKINLDRKDLLGGMPGGQTELLWIATQGEAVASFEGALADGDFKLVARAMVVRTLASIKGDDEEKRLSRLF